MKKGDHIGVIGAGLAGLTAARLLADAGHSVVIFDKGRGLGGRMASRRKDGWRFDHGAVVLRPTDDAFKALIADAAADGHAAPWNAATGWTGLPGMSGVVKPAAKTLEIHNKAEVLGLERHGDGWALQGIAQTEGRVFDHLILATPQPQTHRLLAPVPHVQAQVESAQMDPCWTLMVGFDTQLLSDLSYSNDCSGPISVIARETAKPGRDLPGDAWVIQAGAAWSHAHLECERGEIETKLLAAFFAALGCAPVVPVITMAHRWRYALTTTPLGQEFLTDADIGLSICGDWCLGSTAQDAFNSGRALAASLLSH